MAEIPVLYAHFVNAMKRIIPDANFSNVSPIYQQLKTTAEGQRAIRDLVEGKAVNRDFILSAGTEYKEPAARAEERKAQLARKRAKGGCAGLDASDCRANSKCFYKPNAKQCAKFKYGYRVGLRSPPTSPCTDRELLNDEKKCIADRRCEFTGAGCRRKYGTSPRRRSSPR